MRLLDIVPLPFGLGRPPVTLAAPRTVALPRTAIRNRRLRQPTPRTIAPPVAGLLVLTADNRPQDPGAWQNEPGPGAGESPDLETVRQPIAAMESVPRIVVPAA